MSNSKIEWTQKTWNPTVGCTKVSAGCKECYAMKMAWRHIHNPKTKKDYEGTVMKTENGEINWTGKINLLHERLQEPFSWKKPTIVFVDSMSDLFHADVPDEYIAKVFAIMALCPQHIFQILTKRPDRMLHFLTLNNEDFALLMENAIYEMGLSENEDADVDTLACKVYNYSGNNFPLPNVWLGVSVENQKEADERIPLLIRTPAAKRFLSCEPLLGNIDLDNLNALYKTEGKMVASLWHYLIDWVIAGGESGSNARPMHPEWVRSLRDQCTRAAVPFFFKQWGEYRPHEEWLLTKRADRFKREMIWLDYEGKTLEDADLKTVKGRNMILIMKDGKHNAGRLLDGKEWNEMPEK